MAAVINPQSFSLPRELKASANATLDEWTASDKVSRLWAGDSSLWTSADESKWLGWLSIAAEQAKTADRFVKFAEEVQVSGFAHAVLLGMGGSSLCPEVFRKTFGKVAGFPELHVLDSTDPAQIKAIENQIDLTRTLFFVSSKSGTTLEPNIFKQYFFERFGRGSFHSYHRSGFEAATSRRARPVSKDIPGGREHWRQVFGAVRLWFGAGGGDGRRRSEVPGSDECNGH
jgi:glucose-6-phosphate isomerase